MEKWSIGNQNWQIIYRWKALDEENTLGKFIFDLVHCKSLAFKGKIFECRIQLGDLESNKINRQFRGVQVGPTILLESLLAQKTVTLYIILQVKLVHTTEINKIEDFILVFEKEEQGRIKLQS
jgi:hypothetical protein